MLMFHPFTQHHPTSREITIMSKKPNDNRLTLAALLTASLFLSATVMAGDYTVRNDKELESVLKIAADPVKNIVFIDNIIVENPQVFEINPRDRVYIDLDRYNFQGNGAVYLRGDGQITIHGSTTGFNGGLHIRDHITLNYEGIYSMSGIDRFGDAVGDDVIVNLIKPGSKWNGSILPGPFLEKLADADTRDGTIIIGDAGKAVMNVSSGNTVMNAETILGAKTTGEGSLNLSGGDANWFTSGSFYVGYEGKGTLNISEGVKTRTGSIVVGKEAGSNGVLNITGQGTVVNLYGRQDDNNALMSKGGGVMSLTDGALLNFDDTTTRLGDRSGDIPKLGLGAGASIVDHSKIFGALTGKPGWIIGDQNGIPNANSLTFQNNSVLEGKLNVSMGEIVFNTGSIVTPGLGSYRNHAGFGYFNFVNDTFVHRTDAATYIDFNVHGDINSDLNPLEVYGNVGYLNDAGRDRITIDGDAVLAGDVYLRPLSGYYSDHVDVDFMYINGALTGQYERLNLIPSRWFRNPRLEYETGVNHFRADRNTTPFTDIANSYNLRGVGGALNGIYNAQTNAEWLRVLDWMWLMNDNELRSFMRQLSGETRASSFLMPIRAPWRFAFDRTNVNEISSSQRERQRDRSTFQSQGAKIVNNDVWAAPFYDYFHGSFDGNANSSTNSRFGLLAGYDRALSVKSSLGFLFSYSTSELNQWYSRVSADDYLMGLHFNTTLRDKYELKLWGSYGTQAYRLHRDIFINDRLERMTAGYTGNTVALSSQIAMPIKWRSFILRPLAALDLSVVQQNKAADQGYEAIALQYEASTWAQLFARIGIKADYVWRQWDCNASLSYALMFAGDEAPTVKNRFLAGGPSFNVAGTDLGRHFLNLGVGGRRWLNDQRTQSLFFQYNGEYGGHSNNQTVALGYQRFF